MVKKIMEGNTFNINAPVYYAESMEELDELSSAPAGSLVELNMVDGFEIRMKDSQGNWNKVGNHEST